MSIHDIACRKVEEYEHKNGRTDAEDVSKQHKGYDIEGRQRRIEVKATRSSKIPTDIHLYGSTWRWLKSDSGAWVYIIYDMSRSPKLIMLDRKTILKFKNTKYMGVYLKVSKALRKEGLGGIPI